MNIQTDCITGIPSNTIILDTTAFERQLFRIGERPESIIDAHTSLARKVGTTLSLANLLRSFGVDTSQIVFHNSGNDAFAALVSLQLLLEPETKLKKLKRRSEKKDAVSPTDDAPATATEQRQAFAAVVPPPPPLKAPLNDTPAAPVRGQEQRRGKGRGGKKTGAQQQQERDARVENAMMNLEL